LRGRIENILNFARVRGFREGENPARWRGHLDNLLPASTDVRRVEHHAALPYGEIADFMTALRAREGTSARALEFVILTAARTGEVIEARWSEIDLAAKAWTVPAVRMKADREHRIPLSEAALTVLRAMRENRRDEDLAFPGAKPGRPISDMSMLVLLRRMGHEVTVHGFRSTFRTWAAERTTFQREVIEAALAHVLGNKVEAAYQRGDMFEKRRKLMAAWAAYCACTPARGSADSTASRFGDNAGQAGAAGLRSPQAEPRAPRARMAAQ
jgi:integrase